tara:strand:+ start:6547 stop:6990 length:444 start_codon:yes stop_codon:yes gene_type:complete
MSAIFPGQTPGALFYPAAAWFNEAVTKDNTLAPTPGTKDAVAMGDFGIISIMEPQTIKSVDLHQIKDGTGGNSELELFRARGGVYTKIGGVSAAAGSGDFERHSFTVTDNQLEAGDLLYLQATAKMTAAHSPRGFVDIHFRSMRKGL